MFATANLHSRPEIAGRIFIASDCDLIPRIPSENHPDPPPCLFCSPFSLAFLCVFPSFSKDFRGSAKRKTLVFFEVSLVFSKKKQGLEGQGTVFNSAEFPCDLALAIENRCDCDLPLWCAQLIDIYHRQMGVGVRPRPVATPGNHSCAFPWLRLVSACLRPLFPILYGYM